MILRLDNFFNGKIIQISGQTLEGFPYITYSIIKNDEINTTGKIFINGKFIKLFFDEKPLHIADLKEKNDDLSIVAQYTQRAHSKQNIFVDVRIFEDAQNKFNDFSQNYAYISNTDIEIVITNQDNQEVFSASGITNDKGIFETKYLIPDNSKRETLTITINAENKNSYSSKIFQVFTLGNIPSDGGP